MIILKRCIVFYFVVIIFFVWVYLVMYFIFINEFELEENRVVNEVIYNFFMYDKILDRNLNKFGEWGVGVLFNFLEKKREE